ncbi:MAG: flagellar hook-associated protein FlgL [Firmicutes bacterium]|nr:flagellar hook-associated protein FlgL [Bacillota bacterium]
MRVTNNMLQSTILKNIAASYERLEKYQAQLSTGKLYQRPSDNPAAINQSLNIKARLKDMDQRLNNINDGLAWLNTTDAALRNAIDVFHRVRELAVRGANSTNSQSELNSLAAEVDQLLENIINIANTTYADRYIFAGYQTTTAPFSKNIPGPPPPEVNYNGDSGAINYEIEKGVNVQVNMNGNAVFKAPTDVFQVVADLRDHLLAGDYGAVSQDIDRVDDAMEMITNALMVVGARVNRLELAKDKIEQDKINLSGILSNIEDADMLDVIMKLKMEENVYQSALMTGSMAMQKSLIDFLD